MGDHLQLLATILTAPFRLAYRLFQTALMLTWILVILIVAPFLSFFTMPGYQREANEAVLRDNTRQYFLIDFATNVTLVVPQNGSTPYVQEVPHGYDYQSRAAHEFGRVPPDWGIYNLVGFYGDTDTWTRGKEAPMYAAYAEAATSSDALRQAMSVTRPHARLHFAPKIGMAWTDRLPMPILFGVCPAENCNAPENFRFKEARELFTPAMTKGQAEAIAEMQYMMTDDYWIREAHANGIYHSDDYFRQMAALNRGDLLIQYTSDAGTAKVLVGMEVGYLILVTLVAILAFSRVIAADARVTLVDSANTGSPKPYIEAGGKAGRAKRPPSSNNVSAVRDACEQCRKSYEMLDLAFGASKEDIRLKRRSLAELLHPDQLSTKSAQVRQTGEEQLKRINAACDHLFQCRFSTASA